MEYPLRTLTKSSNRLDIKEDDIEGNYNSIVEETSCCLNLGNITHTFTLIQDEERRKTVSESFRERLSHLDDIFMEAGLYEEQLQQYNDVCLNAQRAIVTQLVNDCRNGTITNYFTVQYNTGKIRTFKNGISEQKKTVGKNIIFTFNNERFISLTGITTGWDEYATAYRHFFCLVLILRLFEQIGFDVSNPRILYFSLNQKVKLAVLSGMKANCTLLLGGSYGSLFEELSQHIPANKGEMNFKIDKEHQIMDITIKDSRFLSKDRYSKEVKTFQSHVPLIDRVLQAILLSQYRLKLFQDNKKTIKPVILFKSDKIDSTILVLLQKVTIKLPPLHLY